MGQHGAIVNVQHGDDDDHQQGQQAVVVPGDLLQEQLNAVDAGGLHIAGNGGGPGGHRGDHADGSRGGVDQVRQLGTGDLVGLGDGTHNGAHGQAVEVVVHEDQHAQQHGQQLRAAAGVNGLLGPAAEGLGAAALVHQVHHDAQGDQEHDNTHVAAVSQHGDDTVIGTHQGHDGIPGSELGVQQRADQAAQEQGRIHFLADQGQHDGHDGGQQGPEGAGKRSLGVDLLLIGGVLHAVDVLGLLFGLDVLGTVGADDGVAILRQLEVGAGLGAHIVGAVQRILRALAVIHGPLDAIQEHAVAGGVERAVADEDGVFLALKLDPQDDQQDNENTQRYEIRYFGTFLFHVCDLPPHKLVVNTISRRNSVSAPPTSCIIPSRQDIVKFLTSYSIILTNCELSFRRFYKRNRAANTASCAFYGMRHKSFRVRGRKKRRRCGGTGVPSVK